MKTIQGHLTYILLIAFLGVSTGLVYWQEGAADESSSVKLSEIPIRLGMWSSKEMQLSDDVLSTLGAREYLLREYKHDDKTLTLYVTYFNSGSGALTHNPEKCYTASGWTFLDKKTVQVPFAGQRVLQSMLARGEKRQIVAYWYQERGHVLVSKWRHIWTVASRALMGNRTHSLVASVSVPVDGPDTSGVEEDLKDFSALVMSALAERVPS